MVLLIFQRFRIAFHPKYMWFPNEKLGIERRGKSVNTAINGAKYKNGAGAPPVFGPFGAKAACKKCSENGIVRVSKSPEGL